MTYDWKAMLPAKRLERGEWWEKAWTLTAGCSKVSQGCKYCWAASMSHTRRNHPNEAVRRQYGHTTAHGDWDGTVTPLRQNLDVPLKRRKPTVYTIWNDLFHEDVPAPFVESVYAVMARCPQHLFVVLTKRPDRAARAFRHSLTAWRVQSILDNLDVSQPAPQLPGWPLPNVVIGTSIEDQATAEARLPALLQCEAAARIVSVEPLLGPVDLTNLGGGVARPSAVGNLAPYALDALTGIAWHEGDCIQPRNYYGFGLDGVIVGGESGPQARPMHPAWVSFIRDQCEEYGVPFFLKQWGEWTPHNNVPELCLATWEPLYLSGRRTHVGMDGSLGDMQTPQTWEVLRVGKRRAGRLLSGRTWDELPTIGRAKQ